MFDCGLKFSTLEALYLHIELDHREDNSVSPFAVQEVADAPALRQHAETNEVAPALPARPTAPSASFSNAYIASYLTRLAVATTIKWNEIGHKRQIRILHPPRRTIRGKSRWRRRRPSLRPLPRERLRRAHSCFRPQRSPRHPRRTASQLRRRLILILGIIISGQQTYQCLSFRFVSHSLSCYGPQQLFLIF